MSQIQIIMNNTIEQYAIGELLDGRYFYVPAYQRGYRWAEKQVGDLLRDLLCFANDVASSGINRSEDQFYCLQPVIVRPITDKEKLKEIFKSDYNDTILKHGVWEVIDGQQRLTTLFLIYKYLLVERNWSAKKLKEEEDGKELYHLCYATREGSEHFLENLSQDVLDSEDDTDYNDNVDYYHMAKAFKYIEQWIATDGKEINQRYKFGGSLDLVRRTLFSLLNGMRDMKGGSIQVLWYEIAETMEKNNIKEFQKINTGKIRLTDAELIKGLFLLEKNFVAGNKFIKQSELAMEWEFIENTLHSNNFWYFLQKKGTDMPNRIDLLFHIIYKKNQLKGIDENEWDYKLKEVDDKLTDTRQSEIFRYYYNRFEGKHNEELQQEVAAAWSEVMELFRTLDDWFCTPVIYNYIGLLSQCGEDISRLILHFEYMPETSCRTDYEAYLKERVSYHLRGTDIDEENGLIRNSYKERGLIYKLLLTLNIHHLNLQNQKMESESDVYKFPFDVLNAQDWDIEHIDSFHTNALKKDSDKEEWIKTAMEDIGQLSGQEKEQIEEWMNEKKWDDAINMLKQKANELDKENGEELKNSIGNLTLLDAQTNRMYGNSLFCTKRRIIIERIKQGIFIPLATQYVFSKFFDMTGTNRSYWTEKDIEAYNNYIFESLKTLLKTKED